MYVNYDLNNSEVFYNKCVWIVQVWQIHVRTLVAQFSQHHFTSPIFIICVSPLLRDSKIRKCVMDVRSSHHDL